jgi:ubiquinone/menaquinone biosynthesis C-methylase UbiE
MKATLESQESRVDQATEQARRAYDRGAGSYDLRESLPERLAFRKWRGDLWALVPDGRVLEVGVGTGRNVKYYSGGHDVIAIDFSPKMLSRARDRAMDIGSSAELILMDVQELEFPSSAFDSAVATFVFCSVPDPVRGLREVRRVLKPGGRVYLLEHVLSHKPGLGWLMRRTNGFWRSFSGANIARETVSNVEAAGFDVVSVQDLWLDIVKLIVAEKAAPS